MRVSAFFLTIVLLIICCATVQAKIIHVPADSATIQGGIDGAVNGDTVMVHPGTYYEHDIDFLGKAITVMSTNPEDSAIVATTVVDGDSLSSVFYFHMDEDSASVLAGLTIKGGYATYGGGIYCYESSPAIINNVISGNSAYGNGGGISNYNSNPKITNCIISGNSVSLYSSGGGMYNENNSSPTVTNCTFSENSAGWLGGGMYNVESSPIVTSSTFSGNVGLGGMFNDGSNPTITNCTFNDNSCGMFNAYNSSPTVINCEFSKNYDGMCNGVGSPTVTNCTFSDNYGSGMYNGNSSTTVINCIFWANIEGAIHDEDSISVVTYSDVEGGYPGEGNINSDPLFANPDSSDYYLQSDSPCIDSGDPSYDAPRGGACVIDLGANEYWQGISCDKSEPAGSVNVP
jgi:parallel beta-helix repeat protein